MKKIAKFTEEYTQDGRSYYDAKVLMFDSRELAEKVRSRLIDKSGQMFVHYSEIEEIKVYESEDEIINL